MADQCSSRICAVGCDVIYFVSIFLPRCTDREAVQLALCQHGGGGDSDVILLGGGGGNCTRRALQSGDLRVRSHPTLRIAGCTQLLVDSVPKICVSVGVRAAAGRSNVAMGAGGARASSPRPQETSAVGPVPTSDL